MACEALRTIAPRGRDGTAMPHRRKLLRSSTLLLVLAPAAPAMAASSSPAAVGIDPYFIGSLLAPNPAVGKAGTLAIQPTILYAIQPGAFDAKGGSSVSANRITALETATSIRYGVTNEFTVQVIPTTAAIADQRGFSSGSQVGDTAVDLDYLLLRGNSETALPAITASLGLDIPSGRYENLANASDGFGNGTYRARLGLIGQSVLFGESQHPIRVRVYANGEIPLGGVGLHGFTTFGTDGAFDGFGTSGISGTFGAAIEYGFTQKFVFAFDVFHGFNTTNHVHGVETNGTPVSFASGGADVTEIAPAFEYSLSNNLGVVAGVALSVAGHNTPTLVVPQIEFNIVF